MREKNPNDFRKIESTADATQVIIPDNDEVRRVLRPSVVDLRRLGALLLNLKNTLELKVNSSRAF